jgi:hypothetical protein
MQRSRLCRPRHPLRRAFGFRRAATAPSPSALVEQRQYPAAVVHPRSSHPTRCWREVDSNPRSPVAPRSRARTSGAIRSSGGQPAPNSRNSADDRLVKRAPDQPSRNLPPPPFQFRHRPDNNAACPTSRPTLNAAGRNRNRYNGCRELQYAQSQQGSEARGCRPHAPSSGLAR